ncbi:MAG: DUF3575 domain-containing protein [Dysgonomonas sp.]|nr:DUF3575 domain-containing protein [Dysgonomonas sp.]
MRSPSLMTRTLKIVLLGILLLGAANQANAQFYSVKADMLGLATTTFNFEASAAVDFQWSLHLHAQYNPWTFPGNKKFKNLTFMPSARRWFTETYSYGYFMGVNVVVSRYNIGGMFGDKYRRDGMAYGAGFSGGFVMPVKRRWNLEFELGINFGWTNYDKYPCAKCGEKISEESGMFVAPGRTAISLVYLF